MTVSIATARELHRSKRLVAFLTALRTRWLQLLGPAFVVGIGYIGPGNWTTDLAVGTHGYRLRRTIATRIARRFPLSFHCSRIIMSGACRRALITATAVPAARCSAFDAIMLVQTIHG
jgi:Mn2+/Fe2+ NRAMP family transporter